MNDEKEILFLVFKIRKLEQELERIETELIDKKLELAIKQAET